MESSQGSEEDIPLIDRRPSPMQKVKMAVDEWLGQISVPVFILVMLFAISSWIDINGLWVELPLLVNALPEGWSLPSYLVIILQVANIGPITYTIANRLAPNHVKEWPVIYIIIAAGGIACLLLSFFWKTTSFINGQQHSTALIGLAGMLALVDCTSSVVFLPYMAAFKPQYMIALYIGEGLSGLIPGLAGLAQSIGLDPVCVNETVTIKHPVDSNSTEIIEWRLTPVYPKPAFSIEVFFIFLFFILFVSGIAFSLLQWLPYCRKERTQVMLFHIDSSDVHYNNVANGTEMAKTTNTFAEVVHPSREILQTRSYESPTDNRDDEGYDPNMPRMSTTNFVLLLFMTAWLSSLTNGILASTQSYSTLPYGSLAYSLSVRLSTVANPVACIFALFIVCHVLSVIVALTAVGSLLAGYQIFLAAASPYPPMADETIGQVLVVASAVLMTGIFAFVKVTIASMLRTQGRKALLICGAFTQVGSFIGALVAFILINNLNLFTSIPPCVQ